MEKLAPCKRKCLRGLTRVGAHRKINNIEKPEPRHSADKLLFCCQQLIDMILWYNAAASLMDLRERSHALLSVSLISKV